MAKPVLEKLRAGYPGLTEEEKGVFSYFIGFQKFRTTWSRETVNAAGVDEFRHTCQRILDEGRVHEYVGTTEAESSGRVKFSLEDAEKFIRDMADGTTELTQSSKGFALVG